MFQFPSNGKARGNSRVRYHDSRCRDFVSIPFKREGTGKPLQMQIQELLQQMFQFPSNGKARGNQRSQLATTAVSILFQFPSNGKARGNKVIETVINGNIRISFQFPSNGKARGNIEHESEVQFSIQFQFPSNGKARGNIARARHPLKMLLSFNSLQTGRHVETRVGTSVEIRTEDQFQFPSNGKARGNETRQCSHP